MAGEVTNFDLLLTRGRALRIGFLTAEQVPSEISRAARVSAHLVVAFCTNGTELRAAAELLGLREREQVERLQSLGKGEAIVALTGDRCPVPILVRFPEPEIDRSNLTKAEREFYTARSLEDLQAKMLPRYTGFIQQRQETKRRERDPNRLSVNAWKVFVRVASGPETIDERCGVLRLNRGEEEAARRECANKGYLRDAGGYGQGIKLFELTPKGRDFAAEHNVPVRKYKSGVVHEALLERVKRGLSKHCPSVRWTSPRGATGDLQPDAYGVFQDGSTLWVEIHCRNKPQYEATKLQKVCTIDHVDIVLLVAPTKKDIAAIDLKLDKEWKEKVAKCYFLYSATDCLNDRFDWMEVLERPV